MQKALLAIGLMAAMPAYAGGVYMGGGGPKLGTSIVPGKFPLAFPTRVSGNFDNCSNNSDEKVAGQDLNDNGCVDLVGGDKDNANGEVIQPGIEKVGFDLNIGGMGVYYADKTIRIGGMGHLGFGSQFSDAQLLGFVDQILKQARVDFYVGGGVGAGQYTFRGDEEERLRVPYYVGRAHTGLQIRRQGTVAFGGTAYAQYAIPGSHTYFKRDGTEVADVKAPASYPSVGIELYTMFGDFKPPKKKKKRRKKKGGR